MAGQRFREILDPLNELQKMTPPADATRRSVLRVREALAPARQTRWGAMPWIIAAGAGAAAAVVLFFARPAASPVVPIKIEPSAAQQLQNAVAASSGFRGVVQVELLDMTLDDHGNPQAAPAAVNATILTDRDVPVVLQTSGGNSSKTSRSGPAVMPVQAVQQSPFELGLRQNAPVNRPGGVTMLIPLTWEGVHTIPIPLTWEGMVVKPLTIGSLTTVTRLSAENANVYRVAEKLDSSSSLGTAATVNVGTVQVDPSTGLIRSIDLSSYQKEQQLFKQRIYYNYQRMTSPSTQPRINPPSGGR